MKWILAGLVVLHGFIHLLGTAKAFGIAGLPQLTQPVSRPAGFAWLAAAIAMLATAVALFVMPRHWWVFGLAAVALSQAVIFSAWADARFGTLANLIVFAGVVYGFAANGPPSFRSEYRRQVGARLATPAPSRVVTEADLERLPEPVRRYLRVAGAVGRPRPHHVRAHWRGRIRQSQDDPWMEFTAKQANFVDEPARFFLMDARRAGLPVDVLHVYRSGEASMRVRLLSLFPLVDARGPEMGQAETVTVFNDLCMLAPGALVDPAIRWEQIDTHRVRAHYTVAPHTITAELVFNDAGELIDFVSDDRFASTDGRTFERRRWSTPLGDYRAFESLRVAGGGEGRWHTPEGDFTYIELELVDLEVDGGRPEP